MQFQDLTRQSPLVKTIERFLDRLLPEDDDLREGLRIRIMRVLALTAIALGLNYMIYRYVDSINPQALWFAIPLLLAETYAFVDMCLFVFMMWKPRQRTAPPAPSDATVDIFITTYKEDIDLVMKTVRGAMAVRYPHNTYVLDDGNRPAMKAACEAIGCGYITRGPEWENRPRHAKAGNVNNALMQTTGEFILILDADQIPEPEILDHTLGYFREDDRLAFVQTPQYFYNVPEDDPFGSQAPLFYGPIQQGKDGWNATFFCGSNAILRREALFQLGLITYVNETGEAFAEALSETPLYSSKVQKRYRKATRRVNQAAQKALEALKQGDQVILVLDEFNAAVREAQEMVISEDLQSIAADLAAIAALEAESDMEKSKTVQAIGQNIHVTLPSLATSLSDVLAPSADTLGMNPGLEKVLRQESDDVLDVQPLATFSITEDMATAMRLHALGWKSIFHSEILAKGLAPEDLGSALGQRLRWAAGTIQVMTHENPLTKPGLSWPQRLQYFTTIYSYFSGFASLIFLVAPAIYLMTGIAPVESFAGEFLWRIVPYLVVNKLLFWYVAWGIQVFRGEQYSLALFPLWIRAVMTVFSGRELSFNVTPKTRQAGIYLNLVIPQLFLVVLLVLSSIYGLTGLALGWRQDTAGVLINIFWAAYDILMLSIIIRAAMVNAGSSDKQTA
jgi:cellulose synthase (UDP-forming)